MRSLTKAATLLLGAATTLAVLPMSPASADNGNNQPGCSRGEICFWWDTGTRFQKQFWYTGNHGGNNFMDGTSVSSLPVQDNARDVTNRDTDCQVRVGNLGNGLWTWVYIPNDGKRYFLSLVNNRNDRHERVGAPGCV
ncbi:hypothetical protein ACWDV4_12600 [Micromonospora sp. NPDC003197]